MSTAYTSAPTYNLAVPQRLPRFDAAIERIHDLQKLRKIVLEAELEHPEQNSNGRNGKQAAGSTPAGDRARLRGVPVFARGVGAAVRGSVPHVDGLR